jgi:hypoxanthine phosphoribosyltransferase
MVHGLSHMPAIAH